MIADVINKSIRDNILWTGDNRPVDSRLNKLFNKNNIIKNDNGYRSEYRRTSPS